MENKDRIEHEIPEGYEARIEGGKVVIEKKESKDERIRKGLIKGLQSCKLAGNNTWSSDLIPIDDAIAWLERQKGQKPAEKPDLVVQLKEHLANTPKEQLEKEWEELESWCNIGPTVQEFLYGKPAEWSEEDEKMRNNLIKLLIRLSANTRTDSTSINYSYPREIDWLKSLRHQPQGTYKQVVHTIFGMLKDKDFYEIQPSHRVSLLNDIRVKCKDAIECAPILDEPHWKPSDEQKKALFDAIAVVAREYPEDNVIADLLQGLYDDLNKL